MSYSDVITNSVFRPTALTDTISPINPATTGCHQHFRECALAGPFLCATHVLPPRCHGSSWGRILVLDPARPRSERGDEYRDRGDRGPGNREYRGDGIGYLPAGTYDCIHVSHWAHMFLSTIIT